MPKISQTDQVFAALDNAAHAAIEKFPQLGLSIEYDKRGKHPSMTIRVMPAVKLKKHPAKGVPYER
jgi:hypothetical protein